MSSPPNQLDDDEGEYDEGDYESGSEGDEGSEGGEYDEGSDGSEGGEYDEGSEGSEGGEYDEGSEGSEGSEGEGEYEEGYEGPEGAEGPEGFEDEGGLAGSGGDGDNGSVDASADGVDARVDSSRAHRAPPQVRRVPTNAPLSPPRRDAISAIVGRSPSPATRPSFNRLETDATGRRQTPINWFNTLGNPENMCSETEFETRKRKFEEEKAAPSPKAPPPASASASTPKPPSSPVFRLPQSSRQPVPSGPSVPPAPAGHAVPPMHTGHPLHAQQPLGPPPPRPPARPGVSRISGGLSGLSGLSGQPPPSRALPTLASLGAASPASRASRTSQKSLGIQRTPQSIHKRPRLPEIGRAGGGRPPQRSMNPPPFLGRLNSPGKGGGGYLGGQSYANGNHAGTTFTAMEEANEKAELLNEINRMVQRHNVRQGKKFHDKMDLVELRLEYNRLKNVVQREHWMKTCEKILMVVSHLAGLVITRLRPLPQLVVQNMNDFRDVFEQCYTPPNQRGWRIPPAWFGIIMFMTCIFGCIFNGNSGNANAPAAAATAAAAASAPKPIVPLSMISGVGNMIRNFGGGGGASAAETTPSGTAAHAPSAAQAVFNAPSQVPQQTRTQPFAAPQTMSGAPTGAFQPPPIATNSILSSFLAPPPTAPVPSTTTTTTPSLTASPPTPFTMPSEPVFLPPTQPAAPTVPTIPTAPATTSVEPSRNKRPRRRANDDDDTFDISSIV